MSILSNTKKTHKLIDVNRVKKISYLLAASRGVGKSSFGHSYLRFSYKEKPSILDPVIEFVADVPVNEINILRGLGLYDKYDAVITSTIYKNVRQYHNIGEDRDLTTYPLNISEEKKNEISTHVNTALSNDPQDKYTFFYKNCAKLLSNVLKVSLDRSIKGIRSIIPIALPKFLRKKGYITDLEYIDYGVSTQRKNLFNEKFPKEMLSKFPTKLQNIAEQMASKSLNDRILGYTKLHLLREELETSNLRKLNLYAIRAVLLESQGVKHYILSYFSKPYQILAQLDSILIPLSGATSKIEASQLKNKAHEVLLTVTTKERKSQSTRKKNNAKKGSKTIKLNDYSFSAGEINKYNQIVTRKFGKKLSKKLFFDEHFYIGHELVTINNKKFALITMAQEKDIPNKIKEFTSQDLLSIKNGFKIETDTGKVRLPMCYAMIEIQQSLLSRVVWAPELKPLSHKNALKAVEQLYNDKIIVIPGFDNIADFTASLDQTKLAMIIKKRQDTEYSFNKRAKEWFKFSDTKLNSNNIYNLKNLLQVGVYPKVYFTIKGKRTHGNKGAKVAHGILITDIQEDEEYYHLQAYDPNFGKVSIKSVVEIESLLNKYEKLDELLASKGKKPLNTKPSFFRINKKLPSSKQ